MATQATKSTAYEGHDENSPRPKFQKGTYYAVGTAAPLRETPEHSTDRKRPVLPYPNE